MSATIDFKAFATVVPFVTAVKKPVLIRGRHGVGKSETVYQLAASVGLPVVERRASQMSEGDLMGLPIIKKGVTTWAAPDWLKECCDAPRVLFLDEVDRATLEVRQGIFQLTDSRTINGYKLHEDTLIFAAVNGGVHGTDYEVGEMDPAELDRWTVFDVEPTVGDWLEWAGQGNIDSMISSFISENRQHLEHTGDIEPSKVYPSRRSWKRFNDAVTAGNLLEKSSGTLYQLACAFVGFEAAVAFNDYVTHYERVVTTDDILNGKWKKTKDWSVNEHSQLVDKFVAEGIFSRNLTEQEMQNFGKYYVHTPAEISMLIFSKLGEKSNENNLDNAHKFFNLSVKLDDGSTQSIAGYLASVAG
jgi:hypothetical protein